MVSPLEGVVTRQTPLAELKQIFASDHVAVTLDQEAVVAIVTKIDLLDFLSTQPGAR